MNEQSLEQMLEAEFARGCLVIGEVAIVALQNGAFELTHRNEVWSRPQLRSENEHLAAEKMGGVGLPLLQNAEPLEIAKFDDGGNYRPLRTAPSLRHGWRIQASNISKLREVIDSIYPGRSAIWSAWKLGRLTTTPLRETLNRQSGMYRAAAKICDAQLDDLIGNFCRSDGGCLRTILWRRDASGAVPSSKLPRQKFDPAHDQAVPCSRRPVGDPRIASPHRASHSEAATVPLLCQEACNLLVAACRDVVKSKP